jgi:hypothetical protein
LNYEEKGAGKANFSYHAGDFIITVPPARNVGDLLFVSVWLVIWASLEVLVTRQLLGYSEIIPNAASNAVLAIFLIGWTMGGGFQIYSFVWNLFGQEIVRLNLIDLLHYKQVFGFRFASKKYRMSDAMAFKPGAVDTKAGEEG